MALPQFPTTLPNYRRVKIPLAHTEIIDYGSGIEQRIARWSGTLHKFKLLFKTLEKTEADLLYDFFIARQGAFGAFEWTNFDDSITYVVRFRQDLLNHDYFTYQLYDLGEIDLVEVQIPGLISVSMPATCVAAAVDPVVIIGP